MQTRTVKSAEREKVVVRGLRCLLGVDGGASKTTCLAASEDGHILGLGYGGPSNHQLCGLAEAVAQIARAVHQALTPATAEEATLGMFCLAGADLPEDYALLSQAVERLRICQKVAVKNDTLAALRSGLSRPWGVVVVSGTGTNAAGRARNGQEIILPGLGHISGDWGGGGVISQEIIRRVMRAWDGRGEPTMLVQMVLDSLGASSPEALLRMLYRNQVEQEQLLELVPLLFEAACAGDAVAGRLVREVGSEIGITARTLIRRLSLENENVEVVLAGGMFKAKGSLLIDTVKAVLHDAAPRADIVLPKVEPVVGALLLALEAAGVEVDGRIQQNIRATLPQGLLIEGR
jgi:N-acetylglucosamine kinase-like BadF-type ATPase